MRLTGLLSFLLFVLIVLFAAPAASYAQAENTSATTPDDATSRSAVIPPNQQTGGKNSASIATEHALVVREPLMEYGGDLFLRESAENDGLCYALRTYVMAREDKTTDVTHLVRQVKCTPARKFNFKTADVRVDRPEGMKWPVK